MNFLLSFVQLITIIVICIYEYKKKFASVFLWATLLVMFGLPHFLSVIFDKMEYNNEIMIKASLFVIVFNLIYLFSKILILKLNKERLKYNPICIIENFNGTNTCLKKNNHLIFLFFGVLVTSFIILIRFSIVHLGSVFNANWGSFYILGQELGYGNALKYGNLLFFASAGIALVYKVKGNIKMFIISLGIIFLYSFITGNRITILPLFMTIIIPYIFNKKRKLSLKQIIIFSLAGISVIYSVYFLRLLRIYGGFYKLINNFDINEINEQIFTMLLSGDGELGLRNAFYRFIDIDNNWPGFNEGHTYIRLLLIAIPTSLSLGLKPPDFAITMGSASLNNISNTSSSMHPTLYGDVFANLWWFGILLGILWAIFTYLIDRFIDRKNNVLKIMLLVLFGVVYVIIGRGSVYNGFFIAYVGSIVIGVFYLITRLKIK